MGKIIRNGIEYCGTSDTADNIIYDNTDSGLAATNTQTAIDELSEKVKSGGNIVYLTKAEYEALPDSKLTDDVEYRITDANTASKIDATDVTYGDSTVEEVIDEVQKNLGALSNDLGAKNLFKNTATSQTINGVTFTVNEDGSVTIDGTATADAKFQLVDGSFNSVIDNVGTYIISTAITDANIRAFFGIRNADNSDWMTGSWFRNTESNYTFTVTEDMMNNYTGFYYLVSNGTTVTNATVYPMVRHASIKDDTYVPYAMTNRQLSESLGGIKFGVDANGNYGYIKAGADTVTPFKGSLKMPYLELTEETYASYTCMKILGYSKISIGSLQMSNESNETSFFAVSDINDTSNTIYKKNKGTSLTNIEIDISGYDGVTIELRTARPNIYGGSMYIKLTDIEFS